MRDRRLFLRLLFVAIVAALFPPGPPELVVFDEVDLEDLELALRSYARSADLLAEAGELLASVRSFEPVEPVEFEPEEDDELSVEELAAARATLRLREFEA